MNHHLVISDFEEFLHPHLAPSSYTWPTPVTPRSVRRLINTFPEWQARFFSIIASQMCTTYILKILNVMNTTDHYISNRAVLARSLHSGLCALISFNLRAPTGLPNDPSFDIAFSDKVERDLMEGIGDSELANALSQSSRFGLSVGSYLSALHAGGMSIICAYRANLVDSRLNSVRAVLYAKDLYSFYMAGDRLLLNPESAEAQEQMYRIPWLFFYISWWRRCRSRLAIAEPLSVID